MRPAVLLVALSATGLLTACSTQGRASSVPPSPVAPPVPASSPSPPASLAPSPPASPVVVQRGDGVLRPVPGGSGVSGTGTATAYVVEVEGGLGVDARGFAREVDRVLADPRSWGAEGRALRRVAGGEGVVFRVTLASPATTDRLCAPLQTRGRLSCGSASRAVLNAARWFTGAQSYSGQLADYRRYLVNHEVGHVLGHHHAGCPGPARRAPVMLQQTLGLQGCVRNPWPYP